ncbi:MAG: ABC transporter ATP-binding protein [Oscillospiraceae bacterium]|nr:ABC transporter ATP-binding protein [Oscillospiraceae bacterium]
MKITDLKKQQGSFLLNVKNAQFEAGKVHGIIGANGSGKTTLSKIIMGTLPYDSGSIDYEGLTDRDITMTGQRPYLMHTSVYNNLIYPLKVRNRRIDENLVDYWLEKAGLQDKKKQYALSLSSGEQQKLSFIRALIFKPKLVIVDETLSNLDPDSADLFERLILEQQQKDPITWITISHQLVHIRKICDMVHFMEKGNIIEKATPQEMFVNPTNPSVIKYLASTEVSFKG